VTDDLTLDGNALAALLGDLLGPDATIMVRACASCGQQHPLGAHRAYRGAGIVLRCPGCGDAGLIVGVQEERLLLQTRGTLLVARGA
jgi:hypothetical protein